MIWSFQGTIQSYHGMIRLFQDTRQIRFMKVGITVRNHRCLPLHQWSIIAKSFMSKLLVGIGHMVDRVAILFLVSCRYHVCDGVFPLLVGKNVPIHDSHKLSDMITVYVLLLTVTNEEIDIFSVGIHFAHLALYG